MAAPIALRGDFDAWVVAWNGEDPAHCEALARMIESGPIPGG
jgi:hypothetical protein